MKREPDISERGQKGGALMSILKSAKELIRLALTRRSCKKQLMRKATELILQQNT